MTKIFISHSNKDTEFARQIAQTLLEKGIDVWIDKSDIRAGKIWWDEIQQGLDECDKMLLILTQDAMDSRNVADEWGYYLTEGKPIFPIHWLPAKIHFRLQGLQYVDFHQRDFKIALEQLFSELTGNGTEIGAFRGQMHEIRTDYLPLATPIIRRIEDFLPPPFEWVEVSGGKVIIEDTTHHISPRGTKGGVFKTTDFLMAKYPITNAQYQLFIDTPTGYSNSQWWDYSDSAQDWRKYHPQPEKLDFEGDDDPRTNITWFEAIAFCRWLPTQINWIGKQPTKPLEITLPTEQQWQRAALSNSGKNYPWGEKFNKDFCNSGASGIHRTTKVTQYPEGESVYGVVDMCGNATEWCLNDWTTGNPDISKLSHRRVIKGGFWADSEENVRAENRWRNYPETDYQAYIGFRLVWNTSFEDS